MKVIEYRASYAESISDNEIIRVHARSINTGYAKALKIALQPLGNGRVRELCSLQFWQVL
jgi:hypothetical protein